MIDPRLPDRFRAKIEIAGDHWLWVGAIQTHGYGSFSRGEGKTVLAHRYAYEFLVGQIPEGMQIDHLCRIHQCVNPAHLEPVSARENARRGKAVTVAECAQGHPFTDDNTRIHATRGTRICRECEREYKRRWEAKNPDKVAAYNRKQYAKRKEASV